MMIQTTTKVVCRLLVILGLGAAAPGQALTLYDPALATSPAAQPWLIYATDAQGASQEEVYPNYTALTSDQPVKTGYSNHTVLGALKNSDFPALDRHTGFSLTFALQIVDESHASSNRAGFSVILLDQDSVGVEIGFWEETIWAQQDNPLFTHGEERATDTTTMQTYTLTIQGDHYTLRREQQVLLSGPVRQYQDASVPPLPTNPYYLPNYLFLGDDTSSAGATVHLGAITLRTGGHAWPLLLMPVINRPKPQ